MVFRNGFSGADNKGDRRLHFTCQLARRPAHTPVSSDFKSTQNTIFGDFFFFFSGKSTSGTTPWRPDAKPPAVTQSAVLSR